jgi:zinc transport system ATP-binding protein
VSEAAVELRDVDFSYGPWPVLEQVNLRIEPGDMTSVVGPNGGGKTTLLKLALGLLQPTRGTVKLFGVPPEQGRARAGYVPQHWNFDLQFPVRVIDVVLMGRLTGRLMPYRSADKEAASKALDEMRLSDLRRRPFSDLSGGQRQRVLIARALAADPQLLLLDEPTANVDAVAEEELHELLHELNERMTIVMVTHDLRFVHKCVSRVICVNRHVAIHPTGSITQETIGSIYAGEMRVIRHDHVCAPGEQH